MKQKRVPIINEQPAHKKKSTAKGQTRSNHKHIYETVLLTTEFHYNDFKTGEPKVRHMISPTKICGVCGRICEIDCDEKFYLSNIESSFSTWRTEKALSPEALALPRWRADFFDKFAVKEND